MKFKNSLSKVLPYAFAGLSLCALAPAYAQSTTFGEGRVPISAGDAASIRNAAKQDAIRDATIKAIKDATAIDASDPKFAAIVNEIAKQLRDVRVTDERKEGAEFVTKVEVLVDRKQIKNGIRGTDLDKSIDRSFTILMLMDEFVTSTRDLNMPLEVLVEFNSNKGSSFSDTSLKASGSSSSSNSAVAASSSVNAATASNARASGNASASMAAQGSDAYGAAAVAAARKSSYSGEASSAASLNTKDSYAGTASSQSAAAAIDRKNVQANSHDTVSYRNLVKYQDTSKPSSKAIFSAALSGNLREYDMKMADGSEIRGKFPGGKVISLATLENSPEMGKFKEFARKENADFLMIGNSTVIGGEKDSQGIGCVVNADVRAFATVGGEIIAASAESMQANGANIEACAAIASKKIADKIAPQFAGLVLGYWADRAARGRQFTVEFKGAGLPLPLRLAFTKALRDIPGAGDVEKKEDGDGGVKVTLTLKGKGDAMELIYGAVSSTNAFSSKTLDGKVVGEQIVLCLDKCDVGVPAKPVVDKSKKK